jgi:hypothetical protein
MFRIKASLAGKGNPLAKRHNTAPRKIEVATRHRDVPPF